MNILLVGFGYVAQQLFRALSTDKHCIWVMSRRDKPQALPADIHYLQASADNCALPEVHFEQVFYTIPPSDAQDVVLQRFLKHLQANADSLIYCGASSVYGDYEGAWVDETNPCKAKTPRERQRLHAEKICLEWAHTTKRHTLILRVAGIYGPGRLPIAAAREQQTLIKPEEAPWSNLISIYDLTFIALYLAQHCKESAIFNVADGKPQPMGSLQAMVARQLHLPDAPYASFTKVYAEANPMRQDFMQSSKRLCIRKLQQALPETYTLLELAKGVERALKESAV